MADPIRVLIVTGSIRQPSHTRQLSETVGQALAAREVKVHYWHLRERPLPIALPDFHDDPARHPDPSVRQFVQYADTCDAYVLASPIYHNSYSGVLKNALDNLTILQFRYKPVGLISHGGDRSTQAVDHLRVVVRGLLAVAIPAQVCTASQDYLETEDGSYQVLSEGILARIERFAAELTLFVYHLRHTRDCEATCVSPYTSCDSSRESGDSQQRERQNETARATSK